ncbi:MAG: hypothetical protein K6E29_00570 [Cyanobacteria bacterium RUI128]|nr:hypothetical protein [Cyanobacteria bacterium RUI128]
MTKIEIGKIINMYNPQKQGKVKPNFTIPDDEFVKGNSMNNEQELQKEKIVKLLDRVNYKNITDDLVEDDYWTNSVNFVGFNKKDGKIDSISIGYDQDKVNIYTVDEFIDLFTNVTADHIEKKPEEEAEYKQLFVNLMTHISKNRVKD